MRSYGSYKSNQEFWWLRGVVQVTRSYESYQALGELSVVVGGVEVIMSCKIDEL